MLRLATALFLMVAPEPVRQSPSNLAESPSAENPDKPPKTKPARKQ